MKEFSLILASLVIGIYCINLLRSYDVHEKEPFSKMLLVVILGGMSSVVLSLFLYRYLVGFGIKDLKNTFGALFVIGPVEEGSKLIALFFSTLLIRKELNEPTDGLVYMSCVALGFSLIENFFYAAKSTDPVQVMALRLFLSTPMHISFSIFIGLAWYSVLKCKTGLWLLLLSFIYASIVHGIYDLILFNHFLLLLLLITVRTAHSWTLSLLGYTTAISPFRTTLRSFIADYQNPAREVGIECLYCGDNAAKQTFRLGNIVVQKCNRCSHYVTTRESLFHIFHHFGSIFKNLSSYYGAADKPHDNLYTLYKGNYVSEAKKIAFFDLGELNAALDEFTKRSIQNMNAFVRAAIPPPVSLVDGAVEHSVPEPSLKQVLLGFLIDPFGSPNAPSLVHTPPEGTARWCWGAFLIPEVWFLWNELWGACFVVIVAEGVIAMAFSSALGLYAYMFGPLIVRLIAASRAEQIYYSRYGRWLKVS